MYSYKHDNYDSPKKSCFHKSVEFVFCLCKSEHTQVFLCAEEDAETVVLEVVNAFNAHYNICKSERESFFFAEEDEETVVLEVVNAFNAL
jgi:hypothetical protein